MLIVLIIHRSTRFLLLFELHQFHASAICGYKEKVLRGRSEVLSVLESRYGKTCGRRKFIGKVYNQREIVRTCGRTYEQENISSVAYSMKGKRMYSIFISERENLSIQLDTVLTPISQKFRLPHFKLLSLSNRVYSKSFYCKAGLSRLSLRHCN